MSYSCTVNRHYRQVSSDDFWDYYVWRMDGTVEIFESCQETQIESTPPSNKKLSKIDRRDAENDYDYDYDYDIPCWRDERESCLRRGFLMR